MLGKAKCALLEAIELKHMQCALFIVLKTINAKAN